MENDAQKIDESLDRMHRLGGKLELLFTALFVATCCCLLMAIVAIVLMLRNGTTSDSSNTVSVLVPLMYLLICCAVVWTLRGISKNIAKGESPFSREHARRISALGWMFVATMVIELIASPGFLSIVFGPFNFMVSAYAAFENLSIPVDVTAMLGAICFHSLAMIWRYGALLQEQTEDLV